MNDSALIAQAITFLKNPKSSPCFAEYANFLGDTPIGKGRYGFVCDWNDCSGKDKVVKVLDSNYITASMSLSSCLCNESSSALKNMERIAGQEPALAKKLAYTKSPHLMEMLDSPKGFCVGNRTFYFIVMPKMKTLEQLPPDDDREAQIVKILADCCEGLQVMHKDLRIGSDRFPSIIHCDLKPNNIFYTDNGGSDSKGSDFKIGDYSLCQILRSDGSADAELSSGNPYTASGRICTGSDIWSLGWILYYWMGGKKHPSAADVKNRLSGDLKMPPEWKNREALWDVFLQMTAPDPSDRFDNAETLKDTLRKALRETADRRHRSDIEQNRKNASLETRITDGTLIGGAAVAYGLFRLLTRKRRHSDPVDSNGLLHGRVQNAVSFMGGTFLGEWEHGLPRKGTFTSSSGTACSGQWVCCEDHSTPFLSAGTKTFSGLSLETDAGNAAYEGRFTMSWPWGSGFECSMLDRRINDGTFSFADGTSLHGDWKYQTAYAGLEGILLTDPSGSFSGCAKFALLPDITAECEFNKSAPGPGVVFSGDSVLFDWNSDPSSCLRAVSLLYDMKRLNGWFEGNWWSSGVPGKGTYHFSNGSQICSNFRYADRVSCAEGILYTGMLDEDNRACGTGTLFCSNGISVTAEFQHFNFHAHIIVVHRYSDAVFDGIPAGDHFSGTLTCSGLKVITSSGWVMGDRPYSENIHLNGLFCVHKKRLYGIGTVTDKRSGKYFEGSVFHGEYSTGKFFDSNEPPAGL